MDWTVKLGVISSIVSIGGGIWSLVNVKITKKIKKEIFSNFKVIKYSNINVNTRTTINQIRKIALRSKISKGLNLEEIISSVNDYYEKIHEISNDLEKENSNNLDNLLNSLKKKITYISTLDKTSIDLIENYNELYYIILEVDKEIDKFKQKIIEK
ncbi:hypothetical protein [Chryseobacterium camelliae]|uniref:hypothetical protein n=1 Tax=Chryseobacterium camelliae TaxID=1265445 RepID=UPI002864D4D0|nr:hypothetical protein [Chryseobacterium camelliae]MDR6516766.1 DNA repair ATPase RecN [Chryseobacterium camelliae]